MPQPNSLRAGRERQTGAREVEIQRREGMPKSRPAAINTVSTFVGIARSYPTYEQVTYNKVLCLNRRPRKTAGFQQA